MTTFTFTKKHILDSALQADHGPLSFTTDTTYGIMGHKKETTLTPQSTADSHGSLIGGSINWRKYTFRVGSDVRQWSELVDLHSSDGDWQWSDHRYLVKFDSHKGEWTVTSSDSVVAIMNVRRPRLFHRDEPASISFLNLPMEGWEIVFLILVMLYSETKRRDTSGSRDEGGKDGGGWDGGNGSGGWFGSGDGGWFGGDGGSSGGDGGGGGS